MIMCKINGQGNTEKPEDRQSLGFEAQELSFYKGKSIFYKIHDFFENVLFALKPLGIMIFCALSLLLLMCLVFLGGMAITGTFLKIIHGV